MNQKSTNTLNGLGRRMLFVVMALLMTFAVTLVSATQAFAATGNITINNATGNTTNFKGFQLFKADVNADGSISNISWANTDVQTAVVGIIHGIDATYTSTNAQDAADWIATNITGTTATTIVDANSTANKIATAVDGLTTSTTVNPGTATSLDTGYWLFVTDSGSIGVDEDGTSPIFAVIGGPDVNVNEKTTVPTIDKQIQSDADGSWGTVADSQLGQTVSYKLTGTVAKNIATYDTYDYIFTDTVSNGLTVDKNSVKVTAINGANSTDVTSSFTIGLTAADPATNGNVLTASIGNLKSLADPAIGVTVDGNLIIEVTYTATINANAIIGGTGNPNTVILTYSNNPNTDGTGNTTEQKVKDYTYQLNLIKMDKDTHTVLSGAKFTIQATTADDTASQNKYVQADGSLGDTAYEFTTDANGNIAVAGLDVGTYTVHETTAPTGYKKTDDFTFTIAATYTGADNDLTTLTNTVEGNIDAHAGLLDTTTTPVSYKDAAVAGSGTVNVTVDDVKQITMPLTGMSGTMALTVYGGAIILISGAVLVIGRIRRSRKYYENMRTR